MKICVIFILTLILNIHLFSQPIYSTGTWAMGFSQVRLHEKFSLHLEAQYRDHGIFNEAEQVLFRGGVNYHINASAIASAGYGHITTFPADNDFLLAPAVFEDRIWEQLILRNTTGRLIFEHRYRLEQRWVNTRSAERYLDRVRYCLRVTIPVTKKTLEKNTIFLSFYDELFIHLNNTPFDRNRVYGAVGYQITDKVSVQAGYLAQTVGLKTKQFLQAAFTYNIDLRKKK